METPCGSRRASALAVLTDRLRELGHDPLAQRLDPGSERLLLALSGHPLADDPIVRSLCDELLGSTWAWLARGPDDLPALLEELDEWIAFQRETAALDPDLAQGPHDPLERLRGGWLPCIAICGADPESTETIVRIHSGTYCVRLEPGDRWSGRRAELADILRCLEREDPGAL